MKKFLSLALLVALTPAVSLRGESTANQDSAETRSSCCGKCGKSSCSSCSSCKPSCGSCCKSIALETTKGCNCKPKPRPKV